MKRLNKALLLGAAVAFSGATPALAQDTTATGTDMGTTIPADDDDGDEGKWGLLGLLGLAGLLGLKRRDHRDDHRNNTGTTTNSRL